jgi:hypothetical protein
LAENNMAIVACCLDNVVGPKCQLLALTLVHHLSILQLVQYATCHLKILFSSHRSLSRCAFHYMQDNIVGEAFTGVRYTTYAGEQF